MLKVDLTAINREHFYVDEHELAGEKVYLVQPRENYHDWTPETLIFRSSVWNADGEPVSLSFKKFFNFEEKPAIEPFEEPFNAIEKLDGSTLIVSKYKGQLITRTRGTVDATLQQKTGHEIEYLINKYSGFFRMFDLQETFSVSYLFEWTTPNQKIVIDYGNEPDIRLIGMISHGSYKMYNQEGLDYFARTCELKRPRRYEFNSTKELLDTIGVDREIEGVCLYYNKDQSIRKVKSSHYLKLHAFKSDCKPSNLAELSFAWNIDCRKKMLEEIEKQFDFECAKAAEPILNQIWPMREKLLSDIEAVKTFAVERKALEQKAFALEIQNAYKDQSYLHSFGYTYRQRGTIQPDAVRKTFLKLLEA